LLVSAVKVDLPKAEATKSADTPQFLSVTLDKAGVIFVNDQALDTSALADKLSAAALANPDTELQLRADTAVPYGRVVEVMGAAQKAGLSRIGFVANPPTP
jgi:biopolymer transport protein TolR